MTDPGRRQFIYLSLGGATTVVFACGESTGTLGNETEGAETGDGTGTDDTSGGETVGEETDGETGEGSEGEEDPCPDLFEGGVLVGNLIFTGELQNAVGKTEGQGLSGRLALDVGTITEDRLITDNDAFFVRTLAPDLLNLDALWTIRMSGLVNDEVELTMDALGAMPQVTRVVMLECSGNGGNRAFGLLRAAEWSGVLLADVLALMSIDPSATRVLISGFDGHSQGPEGASARCSWVFTIDELVESGALLATKMNGEPLPVDHGFPVRLIVPGWYGCCNPKWVDEIRMVDNGEPSTPQMKEFAGRTHQTAVHELAADFSPATMHQAAMPVRVEKWEVGGNVVYKIVGILWGGREPTDQLRIRFNGGPAESVEICPGHDQNDTWTLWWYAWRPHEAGSVDIRLEIDDPAIPTNRLDAGYYARRVQVE